MAVHFFKMEQQWRGPPARDTAPTLSSPHVVERVSLLISTDQIAHKGDVPTLPASGPLSILHPSYKFARKLPNWDRERSSFLETGPPDRPRLNPPGQVAIPSSELLVPSLPAMSHAPQFISLDRAQPPFYVGVDLGGTNIKIGLVDDAGQTLGWETMPTQTDRGPDDGVVRMASVLDQLVAKAGLAKHQIARVGLGSPGTMDIPAGMLLEPHNLPGWYHFPIRERLSQQCGLPVTFSNDANAAAYGEFWVGSGRDLRSMVLFTLGTGIGCGIIVDDLMIEGENSHGAECGHIIIDYRDDARVCGCGRGGHLEAYASATAVIKRSEEVLATERPTSLRTRVEQGEPLTPLMLSQEAERGDELALELIMDTAMYLGIGAVTLLHTIDPQGLVLGGGMNFGGHETELGRRFLQRVREEVQRRAFPIVSERVVIDYAKLEGDAGYLGAAGVARLAHRRQAGNERSSHFTL